MPITVGQDTAKTRKTLTQNGKTISYYSIPAATEAGLGDFYRVLGRPYLSLRRIQFSQDRMQRGGLAGPGRPANEYQPMRPGDGLRNPAMV